MKYVEGQLRCKDNRTDQDLVANKLLYAFMLNRAMGVSKTTLKKESRFYLKTVFAVKVDGTEGIEKIPDSKPNMLPNYFYNCRRGVEYNCAD